MKKPRVVLADRYQLVASGIAELLATNCTVVASVYDSDSAVQEISRCRPDLAVIDLHLPPQGGLDVIRRIRAFDTKVGIIVLTIDEHADVAMQAFREGAAACLLMNCAASDLNDAVRHVLGHEATVSPFVASGVVTERRSRERRDDAVPLTGRQRDVLRLLAEGKSMKQVGDALDLTPRTVAFHKYRIMRKLSIASSAELVRYAVNSKIV